MRSRILNRWQLGLDKAEAIVVEDLRQSIRGYDRGRNMNRRLSGWVKGLIQEAIEATSRRRGASVSEVNAAYTSQWISSCSAFGRRSGDVIHCPLDRVVFMADHVCGGEHLHRKNDTGIRRFPPYRQVKQVLEDRSRQTERPCLASGQCNADPSCLRLPKRNSSCSGNTINGERIILNPCVP
ncbi:transposase [Gammaproteobacteria bacterium]